MRIIVVLFLFLIAFGSKGQTLDQISVLVDSTASLTISDISSNNFKFTNSHFLSGRYPTWVKIGIPRDVISGHYCIDFGTGENIDVYYKTTKVSAGNLVLPSQRSIPGDPRSACISFDDATRIVYVRFPPMGFKGQAAVPWKLRPYDEVKRNIDAGQNVALIISGAMFVIMVCAFVMFYFLKDAAFFYFGVYVVFFYVMVNKNLLATFLGDYLPGIFLDHVVNQTLFILGPASFLVFSFVYFRIKEKPRGWQWTFMISFAMGALCFVVVFTGPPTLSTMMILFYNLIALIVGTSIAIRDYVKDNWSPAKYFVAGISIPLVVAVIIVFHNLHVIFVYRLDLYADSSIVILCFVLGLGVVQRHRQWTLTQENKEKEAEFHRMKSANLEELNETKDKLLSVLSHDLRGPVGNLSAILSLLSNKAMSKEEFDQLSIKLKTDVETTHTMLEEVLQWVRSQREGIITQPVVFDLNVLVSDAVSMSSAQANTKRISIVVDYKDEVKAFADRDHISIVLRNLLGNAIKFSPEGSIIRLVISGDDQQAKVIVKDSGIGISREDVEKILRRERVVGMRGTQGEKGTGLGLFLCQEFISYNRGMFLLESIKGEGTTTGFMIPTTGNL